MQRVSENSTITVVYEGKLADGTVFDNADKKEPLSFQVGTGAVLPAFEKALLGMAINETRTVALQPEEAYGARNEELILELPRENFADLDISPGATLGLDMEHEGEQHTVPATVVEINDATVTMDFNHPLAGQTLVFTITLQAIDAEAGPADQASDCQTAGCRGCSS